MISAEIAAVESLLRARLRPATSGKRFVLDTYHALKNPAFKLTERQAIYLWKLVHLYRRQMPCYLVTVAEFVKREDRLPGCLGLPEDHRPPVSRVKPARAGSAPPPPAALRSAAAAMPEPAAEQVELFPELKHLTAL